MTTLKVNGMTCGSCAGVIRRAVASVAPDLEIHVDLGAREVRLPDDADRTAITRAIVAAGYAVSD